MNEPTCIWCGDLSADSPVEHVIPEALGCPADAVLRNDEVCQGCNNGVLAELDQALVASLDIVRWMADVPGKKGRAPTVSTRANFYAGSTDEGRVAHVNLGPGDVTLPGGRVLKAPTRHQNSVRSRMHVTGQEAVIAGSAQILHHPDCARALHKIAIESIALIIGRDAALAPSLFEARRFVLEGVGSQQVLFIEPSGGYVNKLFPPYTRAEGYAVAFKLCGLEFVVDCTPGQISLPDLKAQLQANRGDRGWSWIPL